MDLFFKIHKKHSSEDFSNLWKNAIIIFDTNTLLDIYRLPKSTRDDFIKILNNQLINSRIWIPFQVILEFSNGRLDLINDQKNKFSEVKAIINESIEKISVAENIFREKLNKLSLNKRHSVIQPDEFLESSIFKNAKNELEKFIISLKELEKKQPDVHNDDDIFDLVIDLFKHKVGEALTSDELNLIYKEGEERYKEDVPPGFEDKLKQGNLIYGETKYRKRFGDLIIWKEILKKAATDNLEYIIFVTNDMKTDWWLTVNKKTLGPRKELLNEIYFCAPSVEFFHMYNLPVFLENAKKELLIDVKKETIRDTKDILHYNLVEDVVVNCIDLIQHYSQSTSIEVMIQSGDIDIPLLLMPIEDFYIIISEILKNISKSSKFMKVVIHYYLIDGNFHINFSSEINIDKLHKVVSEFSITDLMRPYGFVSYSTFEDKWNINISFSEPFVYFPPND